jgi:hypothetical protein
MKFVYLYFTQKKKEKFEGSKDSIFQFVKRYNELRGAEPFLRSRQLCSCLRTSQNFMEREGSLPCSQEPCSGSYPGLDPFSP